MEGRTVDSEEFRAAIYESLRHHQAENKSKKISTAVDRITQLLGANLHKQPDFKSLFVLIGGIVCLFVAATQSLLTWKALYQPVLGDFEDFMGSEAFTSRFSTLVDPTSKRACLCTKSDFVAIETAQRQRQGREKEKEKENSKRENARSESKKRFPVCPLPFASPVGSRFL